MCLRLREGTRLSWIISNRVVKALTLAIKSYNQDWAETSIRIRIRRIIRIRVLHGIVAADNAIRAAIV